MRDFVTHFQPMNPHFSPTAMLRLFMRKQLLDWRFDFEILKAVSIGQDVSLHTILL